MKQKIKVVGAVLLMMYSLLGCGNSTAQEETDAVMAEQEKTEEQYNESSEIQNSETVEETDKKESETKTSKSESPSNGIYLSDMPDTEEKILENVEIRTEKTLKGDVVVFITNNNDYSIPDIEIQALFYKNGNIIDTDKDGHDVVIPKNTVVSKMDAPSEYDDYEVRASIEWDDDSEYRNWTYNLDVNHNIGEKNVIIQFENQGKVEIRELEYIVVFYLDGQIVDTSYAKDVYHIGSGDIVVEEVSTYNTEFDEYEVYVNQAHTFDEEYMNGEIIRDTFSENIGSKNIKQTESSNDMEKASETQENDKQTEASESNQKQDKDIQASATTGQANALKKAQSYLKYSTFSYEGLKGQLEYEGFAADEIQYAVDNCGADWNEQALNKAKSYLKHSSFSYQGLMGQLEYEEFTNEQAVYGADNCGADWNEQAVEKAKSYLKLHSFSKSDLIDQLEYEGFTSEQAIYGAEQNGF